MPDSERYDEERYKSDPRALSFAELVVRRAHLSLFASGRLIQTYRAVSGKPTGAKPTGEQIFDYSQARQKQAAQGPIPAGTYWIRPDQLWTNAWYKRGSVTAWGNFRRTIHPFETTTTFGRGGFFPQSDRHQRLPQAKARALQRAIQGLSPMFQTRAHALECRTLPASE